MENGESEQGKSERRKRNAEPSPNKSSTESFDEAAGVDKSGKTSPSQQFPHS